MDISKDEYLKQKNYIVAGRKTNLTPLICTLVMTEINPMSVIAMTTIGWVNGFNGLWMAFVAFLSPMIAALTTSKKWKAFNQSCVTQFFDVYYGRLFGNIVRTIVIIPLCLLSSTYIKGLLIYSDQLFPKFPGWILILFILGICFIFTFRKGLYSIIRMDILGFFLILLSLTLGFLFLNAHSIDSNDVKSNYKLSNMNLTLFFLIGLFVLQTMMYSVSPWWGQKIFSAKKEKIAYLSSIISSFIIGLMYAAFVLFGIYLQSYVSDIGDNQSILPFGLLIIFPKILIPVFTATFFLIAMTTICGVWSSICGLVTSGYLKLSDNESSKINYFIYLCLSVIVFLIATLCIDNVLTYAVFSVSIIASPYIPVILFFFFKKIYYSAFISVFVLLISSIITFVYTGDNDLNYLSLWILFDLPLSLCLLFISILIEIKINKKVNLIG
jgi:Na+/proline symporter